MPSETICKTIHQYNKEPVNASDMQKLLEIARDYKKVKNYVYTRFGGIASLSKLYPGYTVQNEMTGSRFRETLGMPSVYFYLAIFDALGDIKCQWTRTKTKILKLLNQNREFSEDDKHYLRFLLKVNKVFEAVLNKKAVQLPITLQKQYENVSAQVDTERLNRYLCRQVRKYHIKLHTERTDGFCIAERAYRYADHGIYISIKEKRKRVFVPLTDNNQYKSQLYVKLFSEEQKIEIKVPINVTVHDHRDYQNHVGVAVGVYTMLTTDTGKHYGKDLGKYQIEYADWIREQTVRYNKNRNENPGRKKYYAKKRRLEDQLHSYINQELNRFLKEEKPQVIYIVKLPKPRAGGVNKRINHCMAQWQRGYIRKRIQQKCKEQAVAIVEVLGKDISNECSECGQIGKKERGKFVCLKCGYQDEEKVNTARNVKKRGQGDGALNPKGCFQQRGF